MPVATTLRRFSPCILPLLAVPAFAQAWTPFGVGPSARTRAAMAYDAARGQTLLFGGYDGTLTPRSDFWVFDGNGWTQPAAAVPPGRWGHGMVYDTRRERVVLFGGFTPTFPSATALDDTWEYDGAAWRPLAPALRPSARGNFGFAYDPIRFRTVLFGGAGPNATARQDTWEWNGTAWTQANPPSRPSARGGPAMAFDTERAEVVLFGGAAGGTQFGDTWVYNGSTWTRRTPATSPPARQEASAVFDPLCGKLLLHGGATANYQTIFADAWTWDGVAWTQVPGDGPTARHGTAVAFDLQAGRSVWYGGRDAAGFRDDVWVGREPCPRTMSTVAPAVTGNTARYRYHYPPTAAGNSFVELWTLRNPNAFPLRLPSLVSIGLVRVDLFFVFAQAFGLLGPSGQQDSIPFVIPISPAIVGFTYDVQTLDLDIPCGVFHWAENDVEASVAPGIPLAAFTATPTGGSFPLAVQFTDASILATSWQWDFQDDGVIDSTLQNPTFSYQTAGSYSVRLVATGPGGSSSLTQPSMVQVGAPPSFRASPSFGSAPLQVQFTETSSFPVTAWQWDFENDGIVDSTDPSPSFTYTSNGTYSVRLTVTTPEAPFSRSFVRAAVLVGFVGPNPSLNLAPIAPGTFSMGSPVTPLDVAPYFNRADAQPVHPVTIRQPFWIGRYEVAQAEYQGLMGANPSAFSGPSQPVERVSWHDAVAYCAALTASEQAAGRVPFGYVYRLPTEAEWEYCCRAGTTTEFHFGDTLDCGQARMASSRHSGQTCGSGSTVPVGGFGANAWGLHDMHGNVFEWCLDSWSGAPNYPAGPVADPYSTVGFARVFRGGSYGNPSDECRSAVRFGLPPSSSGANLGFRVVLAPVLP